MVKGTSRIDSADMRPLKAFVQGQTSGRPPHTSGMATLRPDQPRGAQVGALRMRS